LKSLHSMFLSLLHASIQDQQNDIQTSRGCLRKQQWHVNILFIWIEDDCSTNRRVCT
jgi:hypothetical protein